MLPFSPLGPGSPFSPGGPRSPLLPVGPLFPAGPWSPAHTHTYKKKTVTMRQDGGKESPVLIQGYSNSYNDSE